MKVKKVEIEELESLLGPDDMEVDTWKKQGTKKAAETFSTDGPSGFLVVSRSRRDKHQWRLNAPWRENSSASSSGRQWQQGLEVQRVGWSSLERRVMEAVENYLEICVHYKSGHRGLGALDGARKRRGLSKVHPQVLDERRQWHFPAF